MKERKRSSRSAVAASGGVETQPSLPGCEVLSGKWQMSRRRALRGIGAALALPLLDVMGPASAAEVRAARPTVRMAYLYFPNGVSDGAWKPKRTGDRDELLELNEWMAPLEPFKRDLLITQRVWTPRGNGHGAGTATWLTGSGYDSRRIDAGGISADQIAARAIGKETLLPSLELSLRGEGFFSNDLTRNTISWVTGRTPAPRETIPRAIYDRMFRKSGEGATDQNVLDLVLKDARSLRGKVSRSDRRKIDEYLESLRSVERRLAFAEKQSKQAADERVATDSLERPAPGVPTDHRQYVRLMLDIVLHAFWADATRVCSFMLDHGQSNRYFNFIDGVQGTWHALSHWKDASGKTEDDDGVTSWASVDEKRDMYRRVTRWHHEQVAYLLGRMGEIRDGEGTLLDNSMILYGSNLADGHEHAAKDLPLLLAGRGGGTVRSGRLLKFQRDASMSRLHLAMLQRVGVDAETFGEADEPMDLQGG